MTTDSRTSRVRGLAASLAVVLASAAPMAGAIDILNDPANVEEFEDYSGENLLDFAIELHNDPLMADQPIVLNVSVPENERIEEMYIEIFMPLALPVTDIELTFESNVLEGATMGAWLEAISLRPSSTSSPEVSIDPNNNSETYAVNFGGLASDTPSLLLHDDSFITSAAGQDFTLTVDAMIASSGISEVPVPAAVWLFGSALAGIGGIARRSKNA